MVKELIDFDKLHINMNKNKEQIQKISAHVQFETVSPATKLLEERRKMYEVHEAFEVQKEEFKKYFEFD